jgi:hypothetical protein
MDAAVNAGVPSFISSLQALVVIRPRLQGSRDGLDHSGEGFVGGGRSEGGEGGGRISCTTILLP